jgi:8-oxo-dGTP pyrophosphatase MutT (NUDIX family)
MSQVRHLGSFDDQGWSGGVVHAFAGSNIPASLRVSSACAFILDESDSLVLVDVSSRSWDLPGGHIEDGEDATEALIREIDEEVGLTPDEFSEPSLLGWFLVEPDDELIDPTLMLVFASKLLTSRPLVTKVSHEIGSVDLFPLDELPEVTKGLIWSAFVPILPIMS